MRHRIGQFHPVYKPLRCLLENISQLYMNFQLPITNKVDVEEFTRTVALGFNNVEICQAFGLGEDTQPVHDHWKHDIDGWIKGGALLVEDVNHNCAALWFPPDYKVQPEVDDGFFTEEQAKVAQEYTRLTQECMVKYGLDKRPNWHLHLFCKRPDAPSGLVSGLVRPVMELASKEGLPCVLECTNKAALPIYKRFGFEVKQEFRIGDIVMWFLVREP